MEGGVREPRVLVVGGGFAGFECARRLARPGGPAVTLVSPEDYFLYTPLLPEVAGSVLDPRHAAVPLAESLPGVRVLRGVVADVDLDGHTAEVAVPDAAGSRTEHWDRLVLTPGSVTRVLDIPGLAERARGLKTLAEAVYLRDHLLGQLERSASLPPGDPACSACRTVVVVGASYAGTELVAQLRGLAHDAALHYRFPASDLHVVLLDVAAEVMPEVGSRLGRRALEVLRVRGVDVRLETTLRSVQPDTVTLSDGQTLPCGTLAWVAGVTANPLVGRLPLELHQGRAVVDEHLQVPGRPDVFAAGDAAAVPDLTKPGLVTPPTAQHATRQGGTLARNVLASLRGDRLTPYRHRDLGLTVDLGPGFAVANPFGVPLSGLAAKAVTRGYHLAALPHRANRLQVGLDWLLSATSPRPLVSLGLVHPERVALDGGQRGAAAPPR